MATGTAFTVAVNPNIPPRLARLEELANDLWYSWDRSTRSLFSRLNPGLWGAVGHNPKAFLKRVDESLLLRAAEDQVFLANYNSILSAYDSYHSEPVRQTAHEVSSLMIRSPTFVSNSVSMRAFPFIQAASASWRGIIAKPRATCACR